MRMTDGDMPHDEPLLQPLEAKDVPFGIVRPRADIGEQTHIRLRDSRDSAPGRAEWAFVRVAGEEQHGGFVFFETLPEIVSVGLGDAATLAVLSDGQRRAHCTESWEL